MRSPHAPVPRALPAVVAAAALCIVLGGCDPSAVAWVPSGPLVTMEASGGLCPTGMCTSRVVVTADGAVRRDDGPPGRLDPPLVGRLTAAIRAADLDAILSRPFEGLCPTAWDGQELRYTIAAPRGEVSFSSCEVAIDPTDPLFAVIGEAVAAAP